MVAFSPEKARLKFRERKLDEEYKQAVNQRKWTRATILFQRRKKVRSYMLWAGEWGWKDVPPMP